MIAHLVGWGVSDWEASHVVCDGDTGGAGVGGRRFGGCGVGAKHSERGRAGPDHASCAAGVPTVDLDFTDIAQNATMNDRQTSPT
ncbi:hypothetical protein DAVIS_00456 [Mycobacterium marinum]|uniref:Uncharacterized protein n=1 Tax=Mycobacterium marinum TaxID=1781 RepID=A0A3E2N1Z2_MYCMR|nr:hypothetical protein DAVIS_00456 [Mycobacterium marinum]